MAINQAYLFLIFTLNGVIVGLLFDFFRILRKSFKTTNLITYIEDILFWILAGISIIFFMYQFSDGSIRLFMFLGLIFGLVLYMLSLSKIIIKTFVFIIDFFKKTMGIILKVIITPVKWVYHVLHKMIFIPVCKLFIRFRTFFTKKFQKVNYYLKNMKNFEKNVKNS